MKRGRDYFERLCQAVPYVETHLLVNDKDGSMLVLIPEGEFLAGGAESNEGGALFKVRLPAYYIGIEAVTNAQYARFVKETRHRPPDKSGWDSADLTEHPVVCVSWDDAKGYCDWAGLRLPSELEWEKASRGIDGREYPWGGQWDESKCRHNDNRGGQKTAPACGYAKGASPWGCLQMSGNVWEWCADWYDRDFYQRLRQAAGDVTQIDGPSSKSGARVRRGGSWESSLPSGLRSAYRYDILAPSWRGDIRGFRVAKTPK